MSKWKPIVEASLKDLLQLERELMLSGFDVPGAEAQAQLFYVRALIAYLRQDGNGLSRLLAQTHDDRLELHDVRVLARMREHLRRDQLELDEVRDLKNQLRCTGPSSDELILQAEAEFILGAAYLSQGMFVEAEVSFKEASVRFERGGSVKKALRSSLSALAAFSCARPQARLFYEYSDLVEQCLRAEEFLSAATALVNISREFQILGALPVALDYADQAIELFERKERGSREHGLALVHRAHLYFACDLSGKARTDLLYALTIGNREVQSACQVMAEKYGLVLQTLDTEHVLPTWQERKAEPEQARNKLSRLESRLIQLLSEGPRDKFELMELLYGARLSLESKEGRLKNLLARLRRRFPKLIFLRDQKYHLDDIQKDAG